MEPDVAHTLLTWYQEHARPLPWRRTKDPYAIWVAEVMLQQTRVETVKPYYRRWMESFPTVEALAAASQRQVLNLWEGLGYYSRARNLHRAARQVVEEFDGKLPRQSKALEQLAGIGPYTAAAIAAIAFGEDAVALDGNLRRVLARLFDVQLEIKTSEAEQVLREHAQRLLPAGQAAQFNQALMDIGATICTPQAPSCPACPLRTICLAHAKGVETERPVRRRTSDRPRVLRAVAVVERGATFLIGQRPEDRLLGGMWEFPGVEVDSRDSLSTDLEAWLQDSAGIRCRGFAPMGPIGHSYSHYHVTAHPYRCRWTAGEPSSPDYTALQWIERRQLQDWPMGRISRRIADVLQR